MSDPIPASIFAVLKAWTEQRKTGQIALNLHEGRVINAELKERITAK